MKPTPSKSVPGERPALSDIPTLRARARQHIEQGAVTAGYAAERESVIKLLNEALATEIVCVLRYKRHYFMAAGIHAAPVAAEFLEHANEEMGTPTASPSASSNCAANRISRPTASRRAATPNTWKAPR